MTAFDTITHLLFLFAATGFVVGLHMMNHPATARRGNRLSAAAMVLAVATTVALLIQDHLITFFNAVGGGAAALIAFADAIAHRGAVAPADQATYATLATVLGVLIGG